MAIIRENVLPLHHLSSIEMDSPTTRSKSQILEELGSAARSVIATSYLEADMTLDHLVLQLFFGSGANKDAVRRTSVLKTERGN